MKAQKAHITLIHSEANVEFYDSVNSVTPGQAAVFYDLNNGHLIGGGIVI